MRGVALAGLFALAVAGAARAAPPTRDPDWPCQSVKVAELSLASFWTGPDVTPYAETWSQDEAVADLASRVTQRRVPMEQAEQAIAGFAGAAGADAQHRLPMLMAAVFDILRNERTAVVEGLDRFGRRQKELAASIREESGQLNGADAGDADKAQQLTQRLGWDTRLFEQRRQSIQYACAVPAAIEQRLFGLARAIQKPLG